MEIMLANKANQNLRNLQNSSLNHNNCHSDKIRCFLYIYLLEMLKCSIFYWRNEHENSMILSVSKLSNFEQSFGLLQWKKMK